MKLNQSINLSTRLAYRSLDSKLLNLCAISLRRMLLSLCRTRRRSLTSGAAYPSSASTPVSVCQFRQNIAVFLNVPKYSIFSLTCVSISPVMVSHRRLDVTRRVCQGPSNSSAIAWMISWFQLCSPTAGVRWLPYWRQNAAYVAIK